MATVLDLFIKLEKRGGEYKAVYSIPRTSRTRDLSPDMIKELTQANTAMLDLTSRWSPRGFVRVFHRVSSTRWVAALHSLYEVGKGDLRSEPSASISVQNLADPPYISSGPALPEPEARVACRFPQATPTGRFIGVASLALLSLDTRFSTFVCPREKMADAAATAAPVFVLDNTLGAAFVGMVAAATLHGVSCVQALYYYTHQTDKWPIKTLVAAVMLFDTVHQALITHTVYTYVVTNWGNPNILGALTWSIVVRAHPYQSQSLSVSSTSSKIAPCFATPDRSLIQRIDGASRPELLDHACMEANKNIILTGLASLLVVAEFVCIVVFTGIAMTYQTFLELAQLETLSRVVNALAAAGDVLIAACLCVMLHRSRTGFTRSDTMINKLIMFAVNTGVLTSVCAICSLIAITVAGDTFIYIAFFFCIGRLYTNSLLATLNARKMIRGAADPIHTTSDFSYSLREMPKNGTVGSLPSKKNTHQNISIKIDTTQEFATDRDSEKGHGVEGDIDG
ncbi:hypothetical protein NMY22_g10198 [Coprinellus aureogranulatus]|nr:hypothetical protein NMY22_g10198 [Coprinellus aureogranulatus]